MFGLPLMRSVGERRLHAKIGTSVFVGVTYWENLGSSLFLLLII